MEEAAKDNRRRVPLPKGVDPRFEHIVLIMLENRSFDHLCGFLKKLNPKIDGLNGNETCYYDPLHTNIGSVKVSNTAAYVTDVDPEHSVPGTINQVFGFKPARSSNPAPMNGFVYSYNAAGSTDDKGASIMECFDPSQLPVMTTLATEFAVFDRWYSALPGPTQPNRLFMHTATSWGATLNDSLQLAEGYPQKTIYDSIYDAGYSFGIYFHDFPSSVFCRRLRDPKYWECFGHMDAFYSDAAAGTLPNYSFVEPRWFEFYDWGSSDQHPPHDVELGEYFIADVYEALRAGPKWANTLLIITYDEHGGFYDHVSPPQDGVPAPDDKRPPSDQPPFNFDILGVRVPCIAVSPWINAGTVIHEPPQAHFDHTSVLGTIKKVYHLPEFLTKRDAWAATFENLLKGRTTMREDTPTKLPRPGTQTQIEKWEKYSKRNVTPEDIENGIRNGNASTAPVTHLQRDILAIARGLSLGDEDEADHALTRCEEISVQTEHHGAIFVQRQIARFLKRMQDTTKKEDSWVVL